MPENGANINHITACLLKYTAANLNLKLSITYIVMQLHGALYFFQPSDGASKILKYYCLACMMWQLGALWNIGGSDNDIASLSSSTVEILLLVDNKVQSWSSKLKAMPFTALKLSK